ncbi:CPBP family intramembrane glutamic endopeptidase [Deinococcus planocerae]|uniref:CPBP family intramembrane glutamic endopeptidase n=1 Tax=Deinococcus planocerae TaxID=1737569 RepID=UPI000C7F5311|nr:CPBP family intramembrane glutamic endopeptidase [Deinococcus planocerae]
MSAHPAPTDRPARTRLSTTVLLHLLPGWVAGAIYLPLGAALHRAGLPPVWGLLLVTVAVLLPLELALLWRAGALPSLRRPRADARLLGAAGLTLLASAVLPGLAVPLEGVTRPLLPLLPGWVLDPAQGLAALPESLRALTLAAWLVVFGFAGPTVEEAYFRGWLLGRLSPLGRAAAPVNALLFALYHLWQPQHVLRVALTALPLAVARLRTGRLLPGVIAHVTVNVVAWGLLALSLAR